MMEKNRVLPFGYQIENGTIVPLSNEKLEVKRIFELYLNGWSFNKIAQDLTSRNVYYLPNKSIWNKSRVKRILENEKYIGTEIIPPIISGQEFTEVSKIISYKTCNNRKTPIEVVMLKDFIVCAECGSKFKRYLTHQRDAYICSNEKCKNSITYKSLSQGIGALLEKIALESSYINTNVVTANEEELAYLDAEIARELKFEVMNEDKIKSLIFAKALNEYSKVDCGKANRTEQDIIENLQNKELSEIEKIVRIGNKISITSNNTIKILLKTGKEI